MRAEINKSRNKVEKLQLTESFRNKSPGQNDFMGEFYHKFRDKLTSKTLSKNCRRRNTLKLIFFGHHHPEPKIRQRYHTQKRKLQANMTD